jgi:heavy metal sensor kinase
VQKELAELTSFAWQLSGAGLVVLLVGLAGGWLISSRVVRPIKIMSATAANISAANLSERIDNQHIDTELAGLAKVLNAMFDRLESAFQRQTRFTADASHELRTPLAIIRTHAELALSRSRSPEEYRQTLETCLRAVGRMSQLVEGLLTLARADAGEHGLKTEPLELSEVVAESVALVRPLALERRIRLTAEVAQAEVVGDATALGQVVTNLVHNAIQYNRPDGEVTVRLRLTDREAILSVRDTGHGIPEEDQAHIFERFYRVDKARSRTVGGNGLGLAICKSIVEGHSGRIGFETQINAGSTFWVRLPRRLAVGCA